MAKFDVCRPRTGAGYLLDCQADLLSHLSTRLVVPMLPASQSPEPVARLNPLFEVEDEPCVMLTQFAAAVRVTEIGERIASLEDHDIEVMNALDMLISGF